MYNILYYIIYILYYIILYYIVYYIKVCQLSIQTPEMSISYQQTYI